MTSQTHAAPIADPLLHEIIVVEVERMEERLQREHGISLTQKKRHQWEKKILRWVCRDLCRAIRAKRLPTGTIQQSIDHGVLHMQYTEIRNAVHPRRAERLRFAISAFLDVLTFA